MLTTHILLWLLGYYIVNAGVGAMTKPQKTTGFYVWMFGFLQTLCANADRLAEARFGARLDPAKPSAAALGFQGSTPTSK